MESVAPEPSLNAKAAPWPVEALLSSKLSTFKLPLYVLPLALEVLLCALAPESIKSQFVFNFLLDEIATVLTSKRFPSRKL